MTSTSEYVFQEFRASRTDNGEYPDKTPKWYDFHAMDVTPANLAHAVKTCAEHPEFRVILRFVAEYVTIPETKKP